MRQRRFELENRLHVDETLAAQPLHAVLVSDQRRHAGEHVVIHAAEEIDVAAGVVFAHAGDALQGGVVDRAGVGQAVLFGLGQRFVHAR